MGHIRISISSLNSPKFEIFSSKFCIVGRKFSNKLKISILPLNLPQIGDFPSNFLDENVPRKRKFSDRLKFTTPLPLHQQTDRRTGKTRNAAITSSACVPDEYVASSVRVYGGGTSSSTSYSAASVGRGGPRHVTYRCLLFTATITTLTFLRRLGRHVKQPRTHERHDATVPCIDTTTSTFHELLHAFLFHVIHLYTQPVVLVVVAVVVVVVVAAAAAAAAAAVIAHRATVPHLINKIYDHKISKAQDCLDFCRISLILHTSKILLQIINSRITHRMGYIIIIIIIIIIFLFIYFLFFLVPSVVKIPRVKS